MWSIDIIKENKTHQKNTPYCSILTSKGNHIKDSWGCYARLLRQSLGNRLFKLPLQISGGVRTGKKWTPKKRSTAQVDSISLTIYHLHFLGCAFFTNCYFWDIRHILQFLSTRFPFRQFKMVKLSNQIKKKLKIKLCFWTLKKKIADTYNTCMLHRLLTP